MFSFKKDPKFYGKLQIKSKKDIMSDILFVVSTPDSQARFDININTKDNFEIYGEGKRYKLICVNPVTPSAKEALETMYFTLRQLVYKMETSNESLFYDPVLLLIASCYTGNYVEQEVEQNVYSNIPMAVNDFPIGFTPKRGGDDLAVVFYTLPELAPIITAFMKSSEFDSVGLNLSYLAVYPLIEYFSTTEVEKTLLDEIKNELLDDFTNTIDREYIANDLALRL